MPSTTAMNDCQRDASCSLNIEVDCFWSFKEHKEQDEVKTTVTDTKSKP